jgi:hypothetical protein
LEHILSMNSNQRLIKRADSIIERGLDLLDRSFLIEYNVSRVDHAEMKSFRSISLSFILDMYDGSHPYYKEFDEEVTDSYFDEVDLGVQIIQNIKSEIENGYLNSIKNLVSSEIFNDFLEMAEHLLDNDYKDPAAVMIGSVLEEHLRQMCIKYQLPIIIEKDGKSLNIKTNQLNTDLAKKGVYNKLEQKNVLANLDLRNKAAHGHYKEYDKVQVRAMLDFVVNFLIRNQL